MNQSVSKAERVIAATSYLFEAGSFIAMLMQMDKDSSEFIVFHQNQEKRLLLFILLPCVALILMAAFLLPEELKDYIMIAAGVLLLGFFGMLVRGAWHAWHGRMKKII